VEPIDIFKTVLASCAFAVFAYLELKFSLIEQMLLLAGKGVLIAFAMLCQWCGVGI